MSNSEFAIIQRYFQRPAVAAQGVQLGIGDDAALLQVPAGHELVVTMDTLVSGVHFPTDTPAHAIGHKSLAVNLSDLAAMGAMPTWVCLALTLPAVDEDWLAAFAEGFFALADDHKVSLVGGDTTRGPLAITITAHGLLPSDKALRRDGARVGDAILVTGTLGDAALALQQGMQAAPALCARLEYPQPRIAAGLALRGNASSAIDLSDGLLADLGHITQASGVGAELYLSALPRSAALQSALAHSAEPDDGLRYLLAGGDDYELCFTVPPARLARVQKNLRELQIPTTHIGWIREGQEIICLDDQGQHYTTLHHGYEHFT